MTSTKFEGENKGFYFSLLFKSVILDHLLIFQKQTNKNTYITWIFFQDLHVLSIAFTLREESRPDPAFLNSLIQLRFKSLILSKPSMCLNHFAQLEKPRTRVTSSLLLRSSHALLKKVIFAKAGKERKIVFNQNVSILGRKWTQCPNNLEDFTLP